MGTPLNYGVVVKTNRKSQGLCGKGCPNPAQPFWSTDVFNQSITFNQMKKSSFCSDYIENVIQQHDCGTT